MEGKKFKRVWRSNIGEVIYSFFDPQSLGMHIKLICLITASNFKDHEFIIRLPC